MTMRKTPSLGAAVAAALLASLAVHVHAGPTGFSLPRIKTRPVREPDEADRERMAAAEAKRQRRAAKRAAAQKGDA